MNVKSSIKIGLLASKTGVTSFIEQSLSKGTVLAVEEINATGGILGCEIEIIERDPSSNSDLFEHYAEELLDVGCAVLFGCYMSSSRKAVLPVVERRQSMLFYPTLYEGFEYSSCCIYTGAAPNQNTAFLANYLVKNFNYNFVFVGSNYIFPHETNRIMRNLLVNRERDVLCENYVPLNAQKRDFYPAIRAIKKQSQAIIFSTVVGQSAVDFAELCSEEGLPSKSYPVASLTFGEIEASEAGLTASKGMIRAAPYFSNIGSKANMEFISRFKSRFGLEVPISAETEAAYFQVHLFAEAAKRAGGVERKNILHSLPTFTLEAPQGPIQVDGRTHHTHLWPRIGIFGEDGKFKIVSDSLHPVYPDPYLIESESHIGIGAKNSIQTR